MEIRSMNSLASTSFLKGRILLPASGRGCRVSLPSLKAQAAAVNNCARGGCITSSLDSSSVGRSPSSCSPFRTKQSFSRSSKTGRRDGRRGGRQGWAREVLSPPTTEHASASSGEEEQSQEEGSVSKGFEWKSNWYPVISEQDLDKSVPHPFQILGQKVVIWYDRNSAEWKTFTDVCPHRLAPLSEGRIDETGCLQCCYHAWSFGGDGSCTRIPQARDDGPDAKARTLARATSYPTTVKQGILFIWPDENGKEKAQTTSPPITPEHDLEGFSTTATFRDMDYGWDTGVENLLDPSHVPVAHHNVNGGQLGTRDNARPLEMEVTSVTAKGCIGQWGNVGRPLQSLSFEAPTRITYLFSLKGEVMGTTTTYVTPTVPGKCRVIIENGRKLWMIKVKASGPEWWQIIPRWWDHQKMLNLLDGDESLLHGQERQLREKTGDQVENWSKAFFMPTPADRFVSGFRQWLNRYAGKGVKWAEGVNPRLPPLIEKKEDLLDRYDSHTKNCSVCRQALTNFKLARTVLFILSGLLVGGAPLLNVWSHRVPVVIVAGISALLAWRMQVEWIPMFYYKGYDHARIP